MFSGLPRSSSARVRVVQPLAHLDRDVAARTAVGSDGMPSARALEHLRERLAVDELHREEVLAVDLSEVEDLGDVAVGEAHHDPRLVDEHPDELLLPRNAGGSA